MQDYARRVSFLDAFFTPVRYDGTPHEDMSDSARAALCKLGEAGR